jgi:hypothetical protein
MTITQIQPPQQPEYAAVDSAGGPPSKDYGGVGCRAAGFVCLQVMVVFVLLDRRFHIFWIQSETAGSMLRHVLNPASTFYRPVGEFFYWILYHTFALNPVPYHVVAWAIHAINT